MFSWENIRVLAGDKELLANVSGLAKPGTVTALMGPSGSGKTTLLSVLAHRNKLLGNVEISGTTTLNGKQLTSQIVRATSKFVEQEDHLLGCLTVKETINLSVAMSVKMSKTERLEIVEETMQMFGLKDQANTIVGTPLQKGLSGGQKRRLSVACEVVTKPKVLFLDEPTSGLDSKASYEVVSTLKKFAAVEGVAVIASIHQPSTATFNLFDRLVFLSGGKEVFGGDREDIFEYFDNAGHPIPAFYNPAEFVLDLINTDFDTCAEKADAVEILVNMRKEVHCQKSVQLPVNWDLGDEEKVPGSFAKGAVLLNRCFIKARRDYLAYYVRFIMYLGLAILMGTVWLRLSYNQNSIQPFINAIFFSGAFMSFMSVAYIPAYLEDFAAYRKERSNGLYGPVEFVVTNFLVGAPFLFVTVLIFSLVTYFMCNFKNSATGFFWYVLYLFLNLLAAESLTILIATIFPIFVVALALTAFANGLWMAVSGFLVSAAVLNDFWYYTFYWIDYQRYAFQGMMFNQFQDTVYSCGSACQCTYSSALEDQCKIAGSAVLQSLGYGKPDKGLWIGVMLVLIFVLRAAAYAFLKWRH